MDQETFVERHNMTAEIYQTFKDNVDILFARKVLPEKEVEFVNHILVTGRQLLMAIEAEKQFLMSEILCGWAIQQQKLSVAAQFTQQINYSLLNGIDTQRIVKTKLFFMFEYFGELLEQTLTGLSYLVSEYPGVGFEQQQQQLRQMTHLFLFYSIIVSRQPPSVVVKCGEAENHRRSRFWFNTEIRILGGRAFGLNHLADGISIQCLLITDETAKRLRNNAYYEICEHEEFAVEPMLAQLKNLDLGIEEGTGTDTPIGATIVAKFEDMRVAKKEQLRRESVAQKRYHLCYTVRLQTLKHQIDLVGKKVGPKMDVDAKLFMERSFADFVRRPDGDLPSLVNGQEMVNALEMKFQSLLEIPQKPTDQIGLNQPRPFSSISKQHLLDRLRPDGNGYVPTENFLRMPVAEEFCVNKKAISIKESGAQTPMASGSSNLANVIDGEWKLVPFFEWFFKLAEMVNKHFLQMWNDGLIFGFCGKEEAERLLAQCKRPTLLIRFSDIEFAKVKISVKSRLVEIRHHWYDQIELQGRSLGQELLNNEKYRDIEFIWPQTNIEWALGARERLSMSCAVQRKPRQLQPSVLYFENQGAGMGSQGSSGLRF